MVIIIYSKYQISNYIETKKQEQEKISICTNSDVNNDACIQLEEADSAPAGKVNINTATVDILMSLPGIGKTKAENIIKYRNKNGNFTKIEDLKQVEGIGDSIYAQIKDLITI